MPFPGFSALLTSITGPPVDLPPRRLRSGTSADAATAVNSFGFELFDLLSEPGKNLLFSPASIEIALGMMAAGAGGETAVALQQVLALPPNASARLGELQKSWVQEADSTLELTHGNQLWLQAGLPLEATFETTMLDDFAAPVKRADFTHGDGEAIRQTINDWVSDQTNGRILQLLPENTLHPDTRLVLTNALCFKGVWEHPFTADATRPMPFHGANGTKTVQMMQQATVCRHIKRPGYAAILLPYQGERLDMLVVLPDAADGLAAVEKHLHHGLLQEALAESEHLLVKVWLPAFEFEEHQDLTDSLTQLGLGAAFQAGADLTGISAEDELTIDSVLHQAFIAVDETGTEAVAATAALGLAGGCMPAMRKREFRANHPFFFGIRDRQNGALLFMGRLVDPQ